MFKIIYIWLITCVKPTFFTHVIIFSLLGDIASDLQGARNPGFSSFVKYIF